MLSSDIEITEPIISNITCYDSKIRSCGSIRVHPEAMKKLSEDQYNPTDISSKLPLVSEIFLNKETLHFTIESKYTVWYTTDSFKGKTNNKIKNHLFTLIPLYDFKELGIISPKSEIPQNYSEKTTIPYQPQLNLSIIPCIEYNTKTNVEYGLYNHSTEKIITNTQNPFKYMAPVPDEILIHYFGKYYPQKIISKFI